VLYFSHYPELARAPASQRSCECSSIPPGTSPTLKVCRRNRLCRNTDLLSFSLHPYSTYNATQGKACVQQPRHTWPGWPMMLSWIVWYCLVSVFGRARGRICPGSRQVARVEHKLAVYPDRLKRPSSPVPHLFCHPPHLQKVPRVVAVNHNPNFLRNNRTFTRFSPIASPWMQATTSPLP